MIGGGLHTNDFYGVISPENLLRAWLAFSVGKYGNREVACFELSLEEHVFALHEVLARGEWKPDPYVCFRVADPKPRIIHKASVRDRVLFQAVYRELYQIFDHSFIFDSYASREGKGTHAGVRRFGVFARKISMNYTRQAWVCKCDIRKFFDTIDHNVLLKLITRKIVDTKLINLTKTIIDFLRVYLRKVCRLVM